MVLCIGDNIMKTRSLMTKSLALFLALLMAVPIWAATPTVTPELPDPGSTGFSKQQQEQLGLHAMAEVYKQMPVLPDSSPITQYVQQLGRKLQVVIPAERSWPYQFHVIQEKEINAFALPGGPIFINVGTITAADNEAELAGVMAHEMSHVYMQHSAKQAPKAEWANILGALGGLFGGGTIGSLARLGIQFGAGSLLLRYSRKDEAQADATGAIIMYKAGYNPRAMAEFFQKLEKQGGRGGPQFLSDHPNPGNRVEAVDKEIANWRPKAYLPSSQAFASARQQAGSVKAYTAQQIADGAKQGTWAQQNQQTGATPRNLPSAPSDQGPGGAGGGMANVTYDQIRPSSNFKSIDQSSFAIDFPANWQAGSGQSGITIAPSAGISGDAVAYGVVIAGSQDSGTNSLDQATQNLIQGLEQSNAGLHPSGGLQTVSVNGVQGRSATLVGNSPIQQDGQPVREHDWLVTMPRPEGGLLYLVFIAPESEFSRLHPTYQRMLESLQLK